MVLEHERDYDSQWAAIRSIAAKIGCSSETLRHWVRAVERDTPLRLADGGSDLASSYQRWPDMPIRWGLIRP